MAELDAGILQMALRGYEAERLKVENAIAAIRSQLGKRSSRAAVAAVDGAPSKPRRQMSAAARRRIGAAQRKRWKEFHAKTEKPASKRAAPKRRLSAATKAKLVANLVKARAAKAAMKTAGEPVPF
jgi:hypothetical protein